MRHKELLIKQEILKHKIVSGEFPPLIDRIAQVVGHVVQKITRSTQSTPYWYSTILVALSILFISFGTSLFYKESYLVRRERIPSEIALVFLTLLGSLILKIHIDATYEIWHKKLISKIQTIDDLIDLEKWFTAMSNSKIQITCGLVGGVVFGFYAIYYVSRVRGGFIGIGPSILITLVDIQLFWGLYYVVLFLILPFQIRKYSIDLFSVYPRQSETVHQLSRMLFNFVYGWAIYLAAISLVLSVFAVMDWVSILLLIMLGWVPLIVAFILNQYSLSMIINRAKWRVLNEVQIKIEIHQARSNLVQKEAMDEVTRLLDFHNRIWTSRSSVTDFDSIVEFANVLLLPIATLVFSNFGVIYGFLFN